MNAPARLVAFAVALVLAFALGFGAGDLAGPFGDATDPPIHEQHQTDPK